MPQAKKMENKIVVIHDGIDSESTTLFYLQRNLLVSRQYIELYKYRNKEEFFTAYPDRSTNQYLLVCSQRAAFDFVISSRGAGIIRIGIVKHDSMRLELEHLHPRFFSFDSSTEFASGDQSKTSVYLATERILFEELKSQQLAPINNFIRIICCMPRSFYIDTSKKAVPQNPPDTFQEPAVPSTEEPSQKLTPELPISVMLHAVEYDVYLKTLYLFFSVVIGTTLKTLCITISSFVIRRYETREISKKQLLLFEEDVVPISESRRHLTTFSHLHSHFSMETNCMIQLNVGIGDIFNINELMLQYFGLDLKFGAFDVGVHSDLLLEFNNEDSAEQFFSMTRSGNISDMEQDPLNYLSVAYIKTNIEYVRSERMKTIVDKLSLDVQFYPAGSFISIDGSSSVNSKKIAHIEGNNVQGLKATCRTVEKQLKILNPDIICFSDKQQANIIFGNEVKSCLSRFTHGNLRYGRIYINKCNEFNGLRASILDKLNVAMSVLFMPVNKVNERTTSQMVELSIISFFKRHATVPRNVFIPKKTAIEPSDNSSDNNEQRGGLILSNENFRVVFELVMQLDFRSFYPSIITTLDCLLVLREYMQYMMMKRRSKKTAFNASYLETYKLVANQTYGWIYLHYPEYGKRVAEEGRRILSTAKAFFENRKYTFLASHTDSLFIYCHGPEQQNIQRDLDDFNKTLPTGLLLENKGFHQNFVMFNKITWSSDGGRKHKGLIRSDYPVLINQLTKGFLDLIDTHINSDTIIQLAQRTIQTFMEKNICSIVDFMRIPIKVTKDTKSAEALAVKKQIMALHPLGADDTNVFYYLRVIDENGNPEIIITTIENVSNSKYLDLRHYVEHYITPSLALVTGLENKVIFDSLRYYCRKFKANIFQISSNTFYHQCSFCNELIVEADRKNDSLTNKDCVKCARLAD